MIRLHSEQQKYFNLRGNINVVEYEPRRWGKTTLLYYVALHELDFPGQNVLFLTDSIRMANYNYYNFKEHINNPIGIYNKERKILFSSSSIVFSNELYHHGVRFNTILADDANRILNYRRLPVFQTIWETYCNDEIIDRKRQQNLLKQVYGN